MYWNAVEFVPGVYKNVHVIVKIKSLENELFLLVVFILFFFF